MTFVSYAQNFEDVMLWRALKRFSPGRYIDIGAQDPVVDSVSKAFHNAGWSGVHVEPSPFYAAELRRAFPKDRIIEAAVAAKSGEISFYELPGGGLSTARSDIAEYHRTHAGHTPVERKVTAVTLGQILKDFEEPIQWLKVDVEGLEREVFEGWDDAPQRPWIIVVESTFPTTDTPMYEDWEHLVLAKEYDLVYTDGLNRFYLHKDHSALGDNFRYPPNVFDDFELSGTATSLTYGLVRRFEQQLTDRASSISALEAVRDSLNIALDARLVLSEKIAAELAQTASRLESERATGASLNSDLARQKEIVEEWKSKYDAQFKISIDRNYALRQTYLWGQVAHDQVLELSTKLFQISEDLKSRENYIAILREALRRQLAENDDLRSRLTSFASKSWIRLLRRARLIHVENPVASMQFASALRLFDGDLSSSVAIDQDVHHKDMRQMAEFAPTHVNQILALNGVDFVDQVYRSFLRRSPDRAGREHYLDRLRDGDSKESVLLAIADSPEARALPCELMGMDKLRERHARSQKIWSSRSRQLTRSMNRLEFGLGELQARTETRMDKMLDRLTAIEASFAMLASGNAVLSGNSGGVVAPILRKSAKEAVSEITSSEPTQFIGDLQAAVRQSSEATAFGNAVR